MKFLLPIIFVLASGLGVKGQDCKALAASSFFKEVKFGKKLPPQLFLDCRGIQKFGSIYRIQYDSLSPDCIKKLGRLFKILGVSFDHCIISINKKGLVYSIELWSFLPASTSDSALIKPPIQYVQAINRSTQQYGSPGDTSIQKAGNESTDRWSGITQIARWNCNEKSLTIRVTYGSQINSTNIIMIEVKDRRIEDAPLELQEANGD